MLKPFEEDYCLTNKIHCAKHDRSAQFQKFLTTEHRTENIDFLLNAKKKKKKNNERVHKDCCDKYFKLKL